MTPKAPVRSPLARAKNPAGRVDLLLARIFERAAQNDSRTRAMYAQIQPHVEALLKVHLGPKTKRGKELSQKLITLKQAIEQSRRNAA